MKADLTAVARRLQAEKTGLGAFNVIQIENAEFFAQAAERAGRPVVLQISQNAVKYHGGKLGPIARATLQVAEESSAEIIVHLDHAEDVDLCRQAVDLGFSSVMYDGSKLADDENRRTTSQVVEFCHANGVSVEAELGEVGGKNGTHDPSARTDPGDAAKFVVDTGVDLLAVAVGSSHAMTSRDAHLDEELIARIHAAVPVPLVLHGSSGVSDAGMRAAIAAGMTKINVSTHLNKVFTGVIREILAGDDKVVDPRKYIGPGALAQGREVERLLRWYAGQ